MKVEFQGDNKKTMINEILDYLRKEGFTAILLAKDQQELLSEADRVLQKDYYDDVRNCAEGIKAEIDDGEIEDRDTLQERVHEAVDSTQRVMYTHDAKLALVFSKYASKGVEDGVVSLGDHDDVPWSALAFCAFEQDVWDMLEALDVDINEEDLGLPEARDGYTVHDCTDMVCGDCVEQVENVQAPIKKNERYTCSVCGDELRATGK